MTGKPPVVPEGYHAVTPWIIAKDAGRLVAFIGKVFGGKEKEGRRIVNGQGLIDHVEVRPGDPVIMLFDHRDGEPKTPGLLIIYVDDAKNPVKRAHEAGATVISELKPLFLVRTSAGSGTRWVTSGGFMNGWKRWTGRRW